MRVQALAPGKVNLSLFLGPVRADGRHELVTLFESVSLADELTLCVASGVADEVVCSGVPGEQNLVAAALAGLREGGWDAPFVRIEIAKQIPIAAGMGGGSADAAAALRMAPSVAPGPPCGALAALAARLGADVPSQLVPGVALGTGAGDVVCRVDPLAPHVIVIVPQPHALATADVYREADRLGLPRDSDELASRRAALASALSAGARLPDQLIVNDLGAAALSLCPPIGSALDALLGASADYALVCGSGPTAVGLFWGADAPDRGAAAAAALVERFPGTECVLPVPAEFGSPRFA